MIWLDITQTHILIFYSYFMSLFQVTSCSSGHNIQGIHYIFISVILCFVIACSLHCNLLTFFFQWRWQCENCSSSRIIIHAAPLMMQKATGVMQYSVGWLSACKSLSVARMNFPTVQNVSNMQCIKQATGNVFHIIRHLLLHTHTQSTIQITIAIYWHFLIVTFQKSLSCTHIYILTCCHSLTHMPVPLVSRGFLTGWYLL